MCRAAFIQKLKEGENTNLFPLTLSYLLNSHNKGNKDGYFIRFDTTEIRTTDFNLAYNFVVENEKGINNSKKIMLHARMGTHGTGAEFVHGWKKEAFSCYHNGIIELKDKTILNDSLDFFNEVTKNKKTIKNIKREIKERTGSGAFFMIGDDVSFIFSKNHDINIHLINRDIIVINSNDDIHEFNDTLLNVGEEKIIKFGLEFTTTKTEKISLKLDIQEDLLMSFQNELMVIGKDGVVAIEELEVYTYKPLKNDIWGGSRWDYPPMPKQKEEDWYEKDLRYYERQGVY